MIYEITEHQGQTILIKDGNPAQCPFRVPVVLPHPQIQNQAIVVNPICGNACPFFEIITNNDGHNVKFYCVNHSIALKNNKGGQTRPEDTDSNIKIVTR